MLCLPNRGYSAGLSTPLSVGVEVRDRQSAMRRPFRTKHRPSATNGRFTRTAFPSPQVMDDRTCRIPCTRASEGCPALFPFENVEWLLGDKETQLYLQLLAEASITTKVQRHEKWEGILDIHI